MSICQSANDLIRAGTERRKKEITELLNLCESPVEQILLAALYEYWQADANTTLNRIQCHLAANYPAWDGIFLACAEPQRSPETALTDNIYRADLYIFITRFRHNLDKTWPEFGRLVVEVDGHDYHERTKAQASYDKKRDRDLILEGYRVIRFSGSDVYNHPHECAEDIDFHVNDIASQVFYDFVKQGRLEELIIGRD